MAKNTTVVTSIEQAFGALGAAALFEHGRHGAITTRWQETLSAIFSYYEGIENVDKPAQGVLFFESWDKRCRGEKGENRDWLQEIDRRRKSSLTASFKAFFFGGIDSTTVASEYALNGSSTSQKLGRTFDEKGNKIEPKSRGTKTTAIPPEAPAAPQDELQVQLADAKEESERRQRLIEKIGTEKKTLEQQVIAASKDKDQAILIAEKRSAVAVALRNELINLQSLAVKAKSAKDRDKVLEYLRTLEIPSLQN